MTKATKPQPTSSQSRFSVPDNSFVAAGLVGVAPQEATNRRGYPSTPHHVCSSH
jgi:hypothetical protein